MGHYDTEYLAQYPKAICLAGVILQTHFQHYSPRKFFHDKNKLPDLKSSMKAEETSSKCVHFSFLTLSIMICKEKVKKNTMTV